MGSKFSVRPILEDHDSTLRNAGTDRRRVLDYAGLYGLPLALGGVAWLLGWRAHGVAEIIGGLAVLTGFLFGLLLFVFQLRLQLSHDPRVQQDARAPALIDQLFANVTYATLVGGTLTAVSMIAAAITDPNSETGGLAPGWTAAIVALGAHLCLMILLCLKRVNSAYRTLRSGRQTK